MHTPSILVDTLWDTHYLVEPFLDVRSPEFVELDDLEIVIICGKIITTHLLAIPIGGPRPFVSTEITLYLRICASVFVDDLDDTRDDATHMPDIGERRSGDDPGKGGKRKRLPLEEITRFTMVKRIW